MDVLQSLLVLFCFILQDCNIFTDGFMLQLETRTQDSLFSGFMLQT